MFKVIARIAAWSTIADALKIADNADAERLKALCDHANGTMDDEGDCYVPLCQFEGHVDYPCPAEDADGGSFVELGDGVNWVTKGAVTNVKNQGQCGSCWSFSTTGAVEGAHFVASGELLSFSEQELVDCSRRHTDMGLNGGGCNGGLQSHAYQYYESHHAELETEYPYISTSGTTKASCAYDDASQTAVGVSGYANVTPTHSDQLKASLANGPVSIAIEADQRAFQTYKSGVITADECGTSLDHGVLAVGYGTEDGSDYFLVKNSWGPSWGESGYVRIGQKNVCGITQQPSWPAAN